ncbi:hypothetical protein [Rhizobium sp. FKY42]|nr:hypothetical protein [Rhizobium sp. FKY42]
MRNSLFFMDLLQRSAPVRLLGVGAILVLLWLAIQWAISLP